MGTCTVELVNTGTELLLGNVVNTNAAWLGQKLFSIGWRVSRQTVVPDGDAILSALREASARSCVVLVTGGLGPTSDDVTRDALAALFGVGMKEDAEVVRRLQDYFASRNRDMAPGNLRQAMVPEGAEVLWNSHGTAPGLWMPGKPELSLPDVVLLPGPPRELFFMMEEYVLPRLKVRSGGAHERMINVKTAGIGESDLHELVDGGLAAVPGLEWGYCARAGEVDVRLIGPESALASASEVLKLRSGEYIVSDDGACLEVVLVRELAAKGRTVATAESCTGGLIAKRLTDVSGASGVFHFGWVTYANEAKEKELGVSCQLLKAFGAVSEPVAGAMAEGALHQSHADLAVAVSGIAGPGGGTPEKPVGTVCLAWARRGGETLVETRHFPGDRDFFRQYVAQTALAGLLRILREG